MVKNLEEDVMQLLKKKKITPEGAVKLLEENNQDSLYPSNLSYAQPIVQTPIINGQSDPNRRKRLLLTTLVILAAIAGPVEYTKYRERKQQGRATREQSRQTQVQPQSQNYDNANPVQQIKQEQPQEEVIQETIVGLNQWVSSPKLNYEFAVKQVSEKRIDNYTYFQHIGAANKIPAYAVEGYREHFYDLIILDIIARSKNNNSVQITPQYFYLGRCLSTLIKDKTLVEMVSGTTEPVYVTRLTPANLRLVYCEGTNMSGNGLPDILPRSGIMRLSTEDDEWKSLVEIGRMENQELQY